MNFTDRVSYLISAIRVQDPSLDTGPTSPIRVMIDAVAEMATQADIAYDRAFEWDITKKSGRDLDNFVETFGFTRIPATNAIGNVTLTFGYNTTRDYLIPEGTRLYSNRMGSGGYYTYLTRETVGIPRYSAYATLPVVAEFPGASYNARAGEIRRIDYNIEQVVQILNEDPITGGKRTETDEELRMRFRTELFRSNLGNPSWYRNIALRHPRVTSTQLVTPTQETEEHLKIIRGQAQCQEDSLIFTYPETFNIYLPRLNIWLEENRDYIVIVDNETPSPPLVEFVGSNHLEGDDVTVRYRYCSNRSRNNPLTSKMHYLDLYVVGNQPDSVIDYSFWASDQIFGASSVTLETHPEGNVGLPYYIFTRQPVVDVPKEIFVQGRSYFRGRDYDLVKDRSVNGDSTRAKDILLWRTNLPAGEPVPSFLVNYFHEAVVSDIQSVLDQPDMHTAVDDVLVHAANKIEFDIDLVVEWERGISDLPLLEETIQEHFSSVPMGSKIRIGPLMRDISGLTRVAAVFLGEKGISSDTLIRGKAQWKYDVPIPDGSVPILRNLNITTTASNLYN
jgi:hypothetical protein